jgi:hypothetical protein
MTLDAVAGRHIVAIGREQRRMVGPDETGEAALLERADQPRKVDTTLVREGLHEVGRPAFDVADVNVRHTVDELLEQGNHVDAELAETAGTEGHGVARARRQT